jgi:hypothetical protein
MSSSARSIFVFGIYLGVVGILTLVVPNLFLSTFLLPTTTEVWVRVVGMLTLFLSFYFIQSARAGLTEFFRLTVYVRASTILFLAAFVLLGYAPPQLLAFGVADLLGAIWTGLALRSGKLS